MLKKILGIIVMITIIAVGFFQKEAWLDAIKAGGLFSVLFSMLLIAADVFFPIVPFALVAALNGAVFGIANGIWITLTGSMLGTMMLFFSPGTALEIGPAKKFRPILPSKATRLPSTKMLLPLFY